MPWASTGFLANAVIPQIDFGVIDMDIGVAFRSKPVSTKPYVPASVIPDTPCKDTA